MKTKSALSGAFAASLASIASAAHASCAKPVDLDNTQVREAMAVLADQDAPSLEKVFAYEDLACASRNSIRALANEAAIASGSKALREAVMASALLGREAIVVEFLDDDSLTETAADYVREHRAHSYAVQYRDPANACLSLYNSKQCQGAYVLDFSGTSAALTYGKNRGQFTLSDDGRLIGFFVPEGGGDRIPAAIKLF